MRVTIHKCRRDDHEGATHKHYAEVYPTETFTAEEALAYGVEPDAPIYTTGFCISKMEATDGARTWAEGHGYTVAYIYG